MFLFSARFGRKKIMVIFSMLSIITGLGAAYAPDYWSFTIIRFVISFSLHVTFLCAFVICKYYSDKNFSGNMGWILICSYVDLYVTD